MRFAALLIEVVGLLLVLTAVWFVSPWLLAAAAGIALVAAGNMLDRRISSRDASE